MGGFNNRILFKNNRLLFSINFCRGDKALMEGDQVVMGDPQPPSPLGKTLFSDQGVPMNHLNMTSLESVSFNLYRDL